jgi:hypothetical protein
MRKQILAVVAVAGALVAGCAAVSHISALRPPSVPASSPIHLPAQSGQLQARMLLRPGQFQRGIDIDWYTYPGQQVHSAAVATMSYIRGLHANAVSISFPFFMDGTRSDGVHRTTATPTPGQLAVVITQARADGLYVSLRPLLAEGSLGRSRVRWVPANQRAWFRSYEQFLKPYARMAQEEHVGELIVGTELNGFDLSYRWNGLDRIMRRSYQGTLACDDSSNSVVSHGCGTTLQTADAYHPTDGRNWLTAWATWDRTLPRGIVLAEVGIAAAQGAAREPSAYHWPVRRTDPAVQAAWFRDACRAAIKARLGGIYFWSVGLTLHNPPGPTLAHQTTWTNSPGARAIAQCFGSIERTGK